MHIFALLPFLVASAAALAFPGAEGFGRNAAGGRGGTVYVVTTSTTAVKARSLMPFPNPTASLCSPSVG